MRALVFGVPPEPFEVRDDANTLTHNLAHSPVGLRDVPDPQPLHDDWVVTRPRLTGICGSDSKQILLDFGEGDTDNAMAAFCSFPQVMGHEVVADVVALGPAARRLEIGQRVVLNPWLSCGPRGIEPPCPACETGDYSLCWSFTDGDIKPGRLHRGRGPLPSPSRGARLGRRRPHQRRRPHPRLPPSQPHGQTRRLAHPKTYRRRYLARRSPWSKAGSAVVGASTPALPRRARGLPPA